jgi:hypothetical protein
MFISNGRKELHKPKSAYYPHGYNAMAAIVNGPSQCLTMWQRNKNWRQNEAHQGRWYTPMNIKVSRNVMCYNPYKVNTKQRNKRSGGCRNKIAVNAEHDERLSSKVFKKKFQFFS